MATTILQMNFQNSRIPEKPLIIEMNEAPMDSMVRTMPYNPPAIQPNDISFIQSQMQSPSQFQGSVYSLASRSYIDQSDIQPLTEMHSCRYDECTKFHRTINERDSTESPVSPLKNILLYLVIILLILWIIIYTVLTQLHIL